MKTVGSGLPDAAARDAFCQQTDQAFSVIAPAGVGKTHAITERILALAQRVDAADVLPRLMVVTYTKRAAQEMQSRARLRLQEAQVAPSIAQAFNQSYFGTIHSLCVRLLRIYGHVLGLPPSPTLVEREDEIWSSFWSSPVADAVLCRDAGYRALLQICPLENVQRLVRTWPWSALHISVESLPERPLPDPEQVLAFAATGKSAKTIALSQARLNQFITSLKVGDHQAAWPETTCRVKDFLLAWQQTLAPLREWQRLALTQLGQQLASACREYRRSQAMLTYDDQISFAAELLRVPSVREEMKARAHVVILDEAQDTDPGQFEVLRGLAGDRLVMVGDPQQSIYPDRADLGIYLGQHDRFTSDQQQAFEVTFRCDEAIVEWVNRTMPQLLSGKAGQTAFMPLQPGPKARDGQVLRLPIGQETENSKVGKPVVAELSKVAADEVATFLRTTGLEGLRARSWGEVALLCPRRQQLEVLREALQKKGLSSQIHSAREVRGEHPVYAWVSAVTWCLTHPRDGFEVVGVLREVFGCSDHDLAMACGGEGAFWRIDLPPQRSGYPVVEEALETLHQTWLASRVASVSELLNLLDDRLDLYRRLLQIGQERSEDDEVTRVEWRRLQLETQAMEVEGLGLHDIAQRLRDGFETTREEAAVDADAIQLLTCQKAKGLEWDAVLLPLFFQPLKERAAAYPRLRKGRKTETPEIELDSIDAAQDTKAKRELGHFYERLLYVAMTRARHTLVLADEEALFSESSGAQSQFSLGKILLADDTTEPNRSAWDNLSTKPTEELQLSGGWLPEETSVRPHPSNSTSPLLTEARMTASSFPRRVTPHSLAKMPSPEEPEARVEENLDADRPELPAQTPATLYGTWWHELMEAISWDLPESDLHEIYQRQLGVSPDPGRSAREWKLLLNSDLYQSLRQPGLIHRAEIPLLWQKSAELVVEGVADLAVWHQETSTWRLIDWKTNRLTGTPREGLASLVEEYEPQVQAYLDAWRAFFPKAERFEGWLYSTQLGQGIMVGGPAGLS